MKEKIEKLPRWAQEYIAKLSRERDTAVRALNEYLDDQTPSGFFYEDLLCTGESSGPSFKKTFVQTDRITVINQGVRLDVRVEDLGIILQWSDVHRSVGDIAMIPESFQKVVLKTKDKMRTW